MISIFVKIIKLEQLNLSAQQLTDRLISSFLASDDNFCRHCSRQHMKKMTGYKRYLLDYRHKKTVYEEIKTFRYICGNCKASHVLLPSIIIPYRSASLIFIIHVLKDYYAHSLSLQELSAKYDISITTIYRWKYLFEKDKALYLKVLSDIETSPYAFIAMIKEEYDFALFTRNFMKENHQARVFLQKHRYAYCHRYV